MQSEANTGHSEHSEQRANFTPTLCPASSPCECAMRPRRDLAPDVKRSRAQDFRKPARKICSPKFILDEDEQSTEPVKSADKPKRKRYQPYTKARRTAAVAAKVAQAKAATAHAGSPRHVDGLNTCSLSTSTTRSATSSTLPLSCNAL